MPDYGFSHASVSSSDTGAWLTHKITQPASSRNAVGLFWSRTLSDTQCGENYAVRPVQRATGIKVEYVNKIMMVVRTDHRGQDYWTFLLKTNKISYSVMKIATSPLRYPGGKSSLTGFLAATLQINGLTGGTYIEPFCGGAGAAINLLLSGVVREIIINDINPLIYAFWNSVLHDTEELIYLIKNTPVTIEEWHRQRFISKNLETTTHCYLASDTSSRTSISATSAVKNRRTKADTLLYRQVSGLCAVPTRGG